MLDDGIEIINRDVLCFLLCVFCSGVLLCHLCPVLCFTWSDVQCCN